MRGRTSMIFARKSVVSAGQRGSGLTGQLVLVPGTCCSSRFFQQGIDNINSTDTKRTGTSQQDRKPARPAKLRRTKTTRLCKEVEPIPRSSPQKLLLPKESIFWDKFSPCRVLYIKTYCNFTLIW